MYMNQVHEYCNNEKSCNLTLQNLHVKITPQSYFTEFAC